MSIASKLYHPIYGQMDQHWATHCKPFADKIVALFPPSRDGRYQGYFAIVDDERGTFIQIGGREFHADTLEQAFKDATPYLGEYVIELQAGEIMADEYLSEDKMLWARVKDLQDALEGMVWQFAYSANDSERKWISTGGLSALEYAFWVLGWPDPKYVEEGDCAYENCHRWPTCGLPTPEGYKRVCGEHFSMLDKAQ